MRWYVPPRLRLLRALTCVLVALLAIAMAPPVVGAATSNSPRKPVSVPDCFHFPVHKMAELLREKGTFRFDGGSSRPDESICTWITTQVPGRYRDILQISIAAIDLAEFKRSEHIAREDATRTGASFEGVPDIRGAVRAFAVHHDFESKQLAPCKPGQRLGAFGPPACFPQPDSVKINVDSYGRVKPRGPMASIAVAFDAERHLASANEEIRLNAAILSGQIR